LTANILTQEIIPQALETPHPFKIERHVTLNGVEHLVKVYTGAYHSISIYLRPLETKGEQPKTKKKGRK